MLINACNMADDEQRKELSHWLSLKEFDAMEKIDAVTRLYNEMGIDRLAQHKMEDYYEQSRKFLDAVNVPEDRKTELRKYAAQMMKRNY